MPASQGAPDALGPQDLERLELDRVDLLLVEPGDSGLEPSECPPEGEDGQEEDGGGDERVLGAAQQDLGLAGLTIGPQASLDAIDVDRRQQAAADPLESRVGIGHRHEEAIARGDVDDLVGRHRPHGFRGEPRVAGDLLDPARDAAGPLLCRVAGGPANAKQRLAVEEDRGGGEREIGLRARHRPARWGRRRGRLGQDRGGGEEGEGQCRGQDRC